MGKGKKGKGRQQGVQRHRTSQKAGNVTVVKEKLSGHQFPVPGLANLGNTCFFNAVVQNISQSHCFKERLECLMAEPTYETKLHLENTENEVGLSLKVDEQPGPFITVVNKFLSEMGNHGGRALTPRAVFTEVCNKAPRFRSYQQQDSQELLRHLLDAMRSEERIKRAVLTAFNVNKNTHVAVSKLTDKDRTDIKAYGHQASLHHTFVDEVFGGKLISTVECKECDFRSEIRESFLDLSLPIPNNKSVHASSPGGYQTRGKRNKRKGAYEKENETVQSPLPKENVPSKHQLKKERKKQSKQTKRSRGKTQSLQEFLKEGNIPTQVSGQGEEDAEEDEPSPVDEMDSKKGREATGDEEEHTFAVEIAEEVVVKNGEAADEGEEHTSVVEIAEEEVVENGEAAHVEQEHTSVVEIAEEEVVKNGEAADAGEEGNPPVNETDCTKNGEETRHPPEEEEVVCPAIGEEEGQPTPAKIDSGRDDEVTVMKTEPSDAETALGNSQSNVVALADELAEMKLDSNPGTEITTATRTEAGATPIQPDTLQPASNDSLEACLIKFCSSELLTGTDKFACIECTKKKRKQGLERTSQDFFATPGSTCTTSTTAESLASSEPRLLTTSEDITNDTDTSKPDSLTSQKPPDIDPHTTIDPEVVVPDEQEEVDEEVMEDEGVESSGSDAGDGRARSSTSEHERTRELSHEEKSDVEDETLLSEKEDEKQEDDVVYSDALKQLLIQELPEVLSLHLKRFLHAGRQLRKNGRHISFPTLLDMRPFCIPGYKGSCDSKGRVLYSLYGVVEHSGSMHGGHYTAYVRVRPPIKHPETPVSLGEGALKDIPHGDPTTMTAASCEDRVNLEYDMSSTEGHWYYTSDSHVRTATEAEVLKCQAYLLFYEKLPLRHQPV